MIDRTGEVEDALRHLVRKCGSPGFREAVVKAVMEEHRQHQGDLWLFVSELIREWAKQKHYDDRNKYAVEGSRKIVGGQF